MADRSCRRTDAEPEVFIQKSCESLFLLMFKRMTNPFLTGAM
jgi:hypothetical protein